MATPLLHSQICNRIGTHLTISTAVAPLTLSTGMEPAYGNLHGRLIAPSPIFAICSKLSTPVEDRSLARQGKISTNELVRRGSAAGIRRTAKHREAIEFKRTKASVKACKIICEWLAQENLSGGYGEQILCEAQHQLAAAEQANRLPKGAAPADMPVSQIIQKCKPRKAYDADNLVARYAYWLALWAYYAITDSGIRCRAVELALNAQFKR